MKGLNLRPITVLDNLANLRVIVEAVLLLGGRVGAAQALQGGLVLDDVLGLRLPVMTTTERDAIASPADGLILYNSTAGKVQARAAAAWVDLH